MTQLRDTNNNAILISSEHLTFVKGGGWKYICDLLRGGGFAFHFIYYVRAVSGLALSTYSQLVKRHRYTKSFSHFLQHDFTLRYRSTINSIAAIGDASMDLKNYDCCGGNILDDFWLHVVGKPEPLLKYPVHRSNRSLTLSEIEFMKHINGTDISESAARKISDKIMYMFPDVEVIQKMESSHVGYIINKHQEEMDYVNSIINPQTPVDTIDRAIEIVDSIRQELSGFERGVLATVAELYESANGQRQGGA
jgi:hypothetical protein